MPRQTEDLHNLIGSSPLAWIYLNKFVNEGRKPIEFSNHRFLIDYIADEAPVKITKKAAQIGLTVAETMIAFWLAGYRKLNVIHTLQTKDVIKGFVFPKVNPIIQQNPAIRALIKADSESLKQIGDNFIYYRGANAESQAINISADVLNIDELDRSNQSVVEMYQSRLDASEYRWRRYFSNPSAVGFGVDELYMLSDQRHWFIQCTHCNHDRWIDYSKDDTDQNHYIDESLGIYVCGKCAKELTNTDRINGRWVAKFPSREWHGYWFSQVMCPWFSAKDIIEKHRTTSTDYFYNFVLGKAYTPSDLVINRETILRANSPSVIRKVGVAMGVDNGVTKTWVLGTQDGIFAHGRTESWDEIERLAVMYDAYVVYDPNPYPTTPKRLVDANKGKHFICYFKQQTNGLAIVDWGEGDKSGVVYADRTKIIDLVASEIADTKIVFRQHANTLEDYIEHWHNLYRTTTEDANGRVKIEWLKKDNRMSDYPFATVYWRIALSKMIAGTASSQLVSPLQRVRDPRGDFVHIDGSLETDLDRQIKEALS